MIALDAPATTHRRVFFLGVGAPRRSRRGPHVEATLEPMCAMLGEVSVGTQLFVFDERQRALSKDDLRVRMRRLAAKMGGNLVVRLGPCVRLLRARARRDRKTTQ